MIGYGESKAKLGNRGSVTGAKTFNEKSEPNKQKSTFQDNYNNSASGRESKPGPDCSK